MADEKPAIEYNTENLPTQIPILPLFDAALFPKWCCPWW
jgi:ATP-dependent Lon protease